MTEKQLAIHVMELVGSVENIDPEKAYTIYFDTGGICRIEDDGPNHTEIKSIYGNKQIPMASGLSYTLDGQSIISQLK